MAKIVESAFEQIVNNPVSADGDCIDVKPVSTGALLKSAIPC